ncbi:MAG: glycosyltransferase family 2 protein [Planctomycetota bacterium]
MSPGYDILREEALLGDTLVILPVYNEFPILTCTLKAIRAHWAGNLLVVDDASTDESGGYLERREGLTLIRNQENEGAGGVLLRGFSYAAERGYRYAVTMDSDGQHNAAQIPEFHCRIRHERADMIWGTRYPGGFTALAEPFRPRQAINREITARLNAVTGWGITDSFCGFRAYKVESLRKLPLREKGYGMFLELAVLAWKAGLSMKEHPVPLIYLDQTRDFQRQFVDHEVRRRYYHEVIDRALAEADRTEKPEERK